MSVLDKFKEWVSEEPIRAIRHLIALLCLLFAFFKFVGLAASSEGEVMSFVGGFFSVLILLLVAVGLVFKELILPLIHKAGSIITDVIFPSKSAKKMSLDYRLADFYLKEERLDEALHEYGRLLHDYPEDHHCCSMIALIHERQGELDKAEQYRARAERLTPREPDPESEAEGNLASNKVVSEATEAPTPEASVEEVPTSEPKGDDASPLLKAPKFD